MMIRNQWLASVLLAVMTAGVQSGCKRSLLPSSNLPVSAENRAIMAFMDEYQKAFEQLSAPSVMALVAGDFYEAGEGTSSEDGYGKEELEIKLEGIFRKVKKANFHFYVQHIQKKDNGIVEVFYYYNERALAAFPAGEGWLSVADVNRLTLRKKGKTYKDGYEIVKGL